MPLFHFSERDDIERFVPRPVAVSSARPPGREWLNGPLVWAIDEWHQPMYLFPRDCPRILLWPIAGTTDEDRLRWIGPGDCRMVAYVERAWLERIERARLFRYRLPGESFESLSDAGMWVSRGEVVPVAVEPVDDLPAALAPARSSCGSWTAWRRYERPRAARSISAASACAMRQAGPVMAERRRGAERCPRALAR